MDVLHPDPRLPDTGARKPFPAQAFRHGPFLVDGEGSLHPDGRPALRFAWRGRRCEARVMPGRVALSVAAGAVPYTAEKQARRRGALAELTRLPAALPAGWHLRILPSHRLRLETEQKLPDPSGAAALVSAMVRFALQLDPYLDRLEAAGVAA